MNALRTLARATFGRDPVVTVSVLTAALIAWLPALGWSDASTGAVTAAVVAIAGMVSALLVSVDRALPLLVGLGKAVIAAVATFGVHLPDTQVTAIMATLTIIAGLATRPQVGAKQPPRDRYGREVDHIGYPVGVLDTTVDTGFTASQHRPPDTMVTEVLDRVPDGDMGHGGPPTESLPRVREQQRQDHRPGRHSTREEWPGRHGRLGPQLGT